MIISLRYLLCSASPCKQHLKNIPQIQNTLRLPAELSAGSKNTFKKYLFVFFYTEQFEAEQDASFERYYGKPGMALPVSLGSAGKIHKTCADKFTGTLRFHGDHYPQMPAAEIDVIKQYCGLINKSGESAFHADGGTASVLRRYSQPLITYHP